MYGETLRNFKKIVEDKKKVVWKMNSIMQTLKGALSAQMNPHDARRQKEANQWLEKFQNDPSAFAVVDAILSSERDNHVLFFAAHTLHRKISNHFEQLKRQDPSMVLKLRVTLIAHVKRHKNSSRQVREKLCQAIAQLAIQDMSWKSVCADLTSKFGRDDMESLLRIFKLLPEECHNKKSTAHVENQRQRAKEFDNCAGDVLGLLTQCMNMARGNLSLVKGVLQCQRSWLQYSNIPTRVMASSPLLVMPFDALNSRELFEDALKTILETVKMYWDSSRHLDVVKIILPRVLQLEARYKSAVQSKNVDAARDFIRIFVETGEAYMNLLLGPDINIVLPGNVVMNQSKIVHLVFECSRHPERDLAELTFYFWYSLSEGLHSIRDRNLRERRVEDYMKYFDKLLEICLPLLRIPKDYATMNKMDKDEIDRSRNEIGKTLLDCCMVLGTQRCASSLYRVFTQCCQSFVKMPAQNWIDLEASMFAFVKIQREILHGTNNGVNEPFVDQIMGSDTSKSFSGVFTSCISVHGMLSKSPKNKMVTPLRNTCLDIMGSYSSWLCGHPELLEHVFRNSVSALGIVETRHFAARVFQDVSHACGKHLAHSKKLFQNLLKVHLDAIRAPLPKRELLLITEALASIVRSVLFGENS